MPRFTDAERKIIQKALLEEGERLFAVHGLKKVTVDDLAAAVNISKGSFYAFYESKEHLFITINFNLQTQLFDELRKYLESNRYLPPQDLAAKGLQMLYKRAMEYPILPNIDMVVIHHLQRKLKPEVFEYHMVDDVAMVKMMGEYGINFKQSEILIAKTMQTLYACACSLAGDGDSDKIMDILISGIVSQIQ